MHARCARRPPRRPTHRGPAVITQDDLPADGLAHVRRSVRREFGAPLEEVFSEFDAVPLASASVAQAHAAMPRTRSAHAHARAHMHAHARARAHTHAHAQAQHVHARAHARAHAQVHAATLRASGQRVVLKLQHRGIAALMARDMVAARRIAAFVRRFAPSFGVLHTVLFTGLGLG